MLAFSHHAGIAVAQESTAPEPLKRIIPTTATPEGSLEVGLFTEYSTLDFGYDVFDRFGDEFEYVADDFHTWTTEIQLAIGLIEDLELALVVPLVYSSFEAAERDSISRHRTRDDSGIGDVEIALSYGLESDDETFLGLVSLGVELPTNTLDEFFGGASTAGVAAVEFEKYFGALGIIGGIEANYEDDNSWCYEYLLGVAAIPNDRIYSQLFIARIPEENLNRIELSIEYLITDRLSIEALYSHELSGENESIIGAGFNVFFGTEEGDEDD